ncbi:MAG TPA: N-acetylmuramoyl-L-alanine amidase [Candidatus Babeliales bacterium]|nr:N-acetylmuramoyl-L-alanine amidase [Candidatus Babeliales bacterium]
MKKTILLLILSSLTQINQLHAYNFTLMIDPAGDAKHTGREIGDSFERGITLQCAEKLKTMIEERYPEVRVVLTRFPGETLQPLQNANFSNRLDVNFYLSIHFYHDQATRPSLYLYAFSYGDDFVIKTTDLTFYPYDKAYLISTNTTHTWATTMQKQLSNASYQKQFDCKGCFYLPFAPLIGVKSPAIALEIGLKTKHDWQLYLEPIIASITPIINKGVSQNNSPI